MAEEKKREIKSNLFIKKIKNWKNRKSVQSERERESGYVLLLIPSPPPP
jgi:hypothetical protein